MQTIAVLPGDGIGEEVVNVGLRVLETVSAVTGLKYELERYPYRARRAGLQDGPAGSAATAIPPVTASGSSAAPPRRLI